MTETGRNTYEVRNFDEDRRICAAATAGPWEQFYGEELRIGTGTCSTVSETVIDDSGVVRYPDATFITEARTGWPAALDRIRELDAVLLNIMRVGTCDACGDIVLRNDELNAEIERLRAVLERFDDRKHPMMPRSQMARLAIEALETKEAAEDATL